MKAQFVFLHQYLAQVDLDQFIQTTNAILSAIPYQQIGGQDEAYYHTVFYLLGINFSTKERAIVDWRMEALNS